MADENYDHVLEVSSTDGTGVNYYFEAVGFIGDLGIDRFDDIGDKYVDGSVWGGTDVIGFNSMPKGFVIEGGYDSLKLVLDGEPVEPSHLNSHTIEVQGLGNKSSYEISVSDEIIRTLTDDEKFESNDSIFGGDTVRGSVVGGQDAYQYWGNLTGFWCNVDVDLTIDGVTETIKGTPPTGIEK